MKVQDSEEVGLKFNIQKTKIMVSGPISSWQIDGETMEMVADFIFWGLQNHCSHEIKRCLLLERKVMMNLDNLLKSRDFANIGPSSQSYGLFSSHVWMWATKLLQLCPTLCNRIDGSPPGSPVPGTLQARTLEGVAISFSNAWKWKVKVKSLSHVWLLVTPWTAAYQAPPSMGFSRQEYWSGVLLPSPMDVGVGL